MIIVFIRDGTSERIGRGGEFVDSVCECKCVIIFVTDTRNSKVSIENVGGTIGKSELIISVCFHKIRLDSWKSSELPICILDESICSELPIKVCYRTVDIFAQKYIVTMIPIDSNWTIGVSL